MTTATKDDLGTRGELAAGLYLERLGMNIIERNWEGKHGEADIIALDGGDLVFIEVKTRRSDSKGKPEDAVDQKKQKRYGQLATEYLAKHREFAQHAIRFDVIGITARSEDHAMLRHHRSAFVCD